MYIFKKSDFKNLKKYLDDFEEDTVFKLEKEGDDYCLLTSHKEDIVGYAWFSKEQLKYLISSELKKENNGAN